jgi:hypothetical protein
MRPKEEIDRRLLHKIAADTGMHTEEFMYLVEEA